MHRCIHAQTHHTGVVRGQSPLRPHCKVADKAHIEEDAAKEADSGSPVRGQLLDSKLIEQGSVNGQDGRGYGPGRGLHGDPVGEARAHDDLAGCQHQQLRSTPAPTSL